MSLFHVTVRNRGVARKVLRALTGLPATTVYAWSLETLATELEKYAATLTDESARAVWITNVQHALAAANVGRPELPPAPAPVIPDPAGSPRPDAPDAPAPAPYVYTPPTPRTPPAPRAGLDGVIRDLVREILAETPPTLDADAVKGIVTDIIGAGGLLPPTSIIVQIGGGEARELPGVRHFMFEQVVRALSAGEHIWLPGPAGSGKSTLARQAFLAIGYGEDEIHMTGAIETPFQLIGYKSPNGDESTLMTPLRKAVQFGGAFILDDIDRSNPKALAAFNEGLANGFWSFPDGCIKQHPRFLCAATANTYGLGGGGDYVGASRLDAATLDRFTFLEVPYDETAEAQIAGREHVQWTRYVQACRRACVKLGLKHLVTPRATYRGIRLLAAGMDRESVERATIFRGLDSETVQRIKGAI